MLDTVQDIHHVTLLTVQYIKNMSITKQILLMEMCLKARLQCCRTPCFAQSLRCLTPRDSVQPFSSCLSKQTNKTKGGKKGRPVFLQSGVRSDRQQDLHGHGDTGYLCHGVGHGAGGSSQGKQISDAVKHSTHEENQEVEAGHRQRGSNGGVDGPQEEKGEDILHVVEVSPEGARREKKRDLVTALHIGCA